MIFRKITNINPFMYIKNSYIVYIYLKNIYLKNIYLKMSINHTGLDNLGNTCYINTTLQLLMAITELNTYFLSDEFIEDINRQVKILMMSKNKHITNNIFLTRSYSSMIHDLNNNKYSEYKPTNIYKQLNAHHPAFIMGIQQDSFESLVVILDAFHESLKYEIDINIGGIIKNEIDQLMIDSCKSIDSKNYSKIYDLFGGRILQCVICKEDNRNGEVLSKRFEHYLQTNLEIPDDAETIYDCLDYFFADESLDENNLYFDEKSGNKVNSDISKKFINLPKYLIISLKRFKQNNMGMIIGKNKSKIAIPIDEDYLDLSDYTIGYDKDDANYRLISAGLHSGGLNGGHYYAYCIDTNDNKYYEYNDSSKQLLDMDNCENELYKNGYYFIFKKIEN